LIAHFLGDDLIEDHAAHRGCNQFTADPDADPAVQIQIAFYLAVAFDAAKLLFRLISGDYFHGSVEMAKAGGVGWSVSSFHGEIITAQHDILVRRHGQTAVRGQEQVAGGEHQHPGFDLSFHAQGHIHAHLVAVKVRVERHTDHGMQLDGLVIREHRHKCLDAQAVQSGSTVQKHGVIFDHVFQNGPDLRLFLLDQLLGVFHLVYLAQLLQAFDQIRLEEFHRHVLGDAALIELELRAHGDHRAAGIVHALTQQILPETALLAFELVGQ